ncbi:hypothetical protein BGZ96_009464 [Linnemannia gamsii]|uniref:F-box domain-containing protein n=1 Tax=Linnemannia gamsii TaxID=64522 RepID=A0ABQ7JW70_9FUNG|nr:hypothetical protein BGZ96_009464 [Linnemannia gamsii]
MSTACTRFLSMPELIAQLDIYLSKHEITTLIRMSRHLSNIFTPLLYRDMCFVHSNRFDPIYFNVEDNIATNLHHIRTLSASATFIHLFYDLFSGSSPLSLDEDEPKSTTTFFTEDIPPVPFTSCLTRFTCGSKDVDAIHLYPVLSIIRGNPGLTHIHLENVRIHIKQDFVKLLRVVTALTSLQSLVVCLGENLADLCGFGEALFFSCPPSIKQLKIEIKEQRLCDSNYSDFEETLAGQNRTLKDTNDNIDEETTLFPTRNLLSKLRSLLLCSNDIRFPRDKVLSMLTHCPGLRELGLPSLEKMSKATMLEVGHFIGTRCPSLEILNHSPAQLDNDGLIILGIMGTLPPQSLTELHLQKFNDTADQLASMIARHSKSLFKINLHHYVSLESKTIQSILCGCEALEELRLLRYNAASGCFVDTDGAEGEWACMNLRVLDMPVVINDYNKDFQPRIGYYLGRPTPLVLKNDEKRHFKKLERFYQQIGRLVNLEFLRLEGAHWNKSDNANTPHFHTEYSDVWFPAMLSLPCPDKKWPGYLCELSGLKKLRELRGSVGAMNFETARTLMLEEAEVMSQCWPLLEVAEFRCGKTEQEESDFCADMRRRNPRLTLI